MAKAVYFKGVRLWENLRWWHEAAPRQGESVALGVEQQNALLVPDSPNFLRSIEVTTEVAPVSATDDLSLQATIHAALMQERIRLHAVADSLGDLAWVEDDSQYATVTNSETAGSGVVVEHGAPQGSWTTEAGHYVLVCKKSSGLGFVSQITARNGGTPSVTIDLEVNIDNTWVLIPIAFHFPDVKYEDMDAGEPESAGSDKYRALVLYTFQGGTDPVFATDHDIDLDET